MSSFSPWGGLGEPGEACVKCGGKPSTLGAHAPMSEGGFAKMKNSAGSDDTASIIKGTFAVFNILLLSAMSSCATCTEGKATHLEHLLVVHGVVYVG